MDRPHFEDPWLFRYLADPRVLDVIEDFIGPDIVLWSSHFIAKPRGDGKAVPWHTDGVVLGSSPGADEGDHPLAGGGSLHARKRLHAGSRRLAPAGGTARRTTTIPWTARSTSSTPEVRRDLIDEARIVDLELEVGECHFHDAWTLHASKPNHSTMRRCGYTMRYMPANVVFHRGDWAARHHIYSPPRPGPQRWEEMRILACPSCA